MQLNSCNFCGSRDFRADRALAGRLVCSNCGTPQGTRSNQRRDNKLINRTFNNKFLIIVIAVIVIILVIK